MPDGGRMLTYCDVTDLARHADELETLATTDALTGMANRRHFLELADAEWSRFQRYQRPLSLLTIDIDHFKMVNDRFGHDAGDKALTQVAETCRERQRTSDIVGRIGGEEFALLLPETDITQAIVVAERIRGAVLSRPFAAENMSVPITVSIGVAAATLSMSGIGALMKAADRALYDAKAQGRNRVALFKATSGPPIAHAAE
jgi:diguanylate cyclase (GGDEF)-like protein